MSSKRNEERLQWVKPFSTMGISEERLMKMSEREYQNTKDYLISVGETPDKVCEEEDEEKIQQKILEQLRRKREEQKKREQEERQREQQRAHHVPNPVQRNEQQQNAEVSEATRLKNEQDAEYERLVNEYNENKNQEAQLEKEREDHEKEIQKNEELDKQQKYEQLEEIYKSIPECSDGVTIAVMIAAFNSRITRKFDKETPLSSIYAWVKMEFLKLAKTIEIPNIVLRQPTGELLEESISKTLSSEGITKNTLLTCSNA